MQLQLLAFQAATAAAGSSRRPINIVHVVADGESPPRLRGPFC